MQIVGIVGSRDYTDMVRVRVFVRGLADKYPDAIVVSGGARGVDLMAAIEAQRCGLSTAEFLVVEGGERGIFTHELRVTDSWANPIPSVHTQTWREWCDSDYDTFAHAAYARNTWIVKASTQVVSFWDGKSRGTANTHSEATRLNVPLHRLGR